jgi:hypothetical protein
MDNTALVSSIVASIVGQVQSAVADKVLAAQLVQGGGSVAAVSLADTAQQNIDSLVNLSVGIGTHVDVKV